MYQVTYNATSFVELQILDPLSNNESSGSCYMRSADYSEHLLFVEFRQRNTQGEIWCRVPQLTTLLTLSISM